MSQVLSQMFLRDLAQVYASLRPQTPSAAFLSDLEKVYATLPVASDANLQFLAQRLEEWQRVTREFVRSHLKDLKDRLPDDPFLCPISLFRTMDYGRLETAHTRALAWLLNPQGEHGFGNKLLHALLQRLSGDFGSAGFLVSKVDSKVMIGSSNALGRLDVLVEGTWHDEKRKGWMLAIEAKVDAQEGDGQLEKYDRWIDSHAAGREILRVFLTIDGRAPDSGGEEWELLSFLELVRIFRSAYNELVNEPGFHYLRFYLAGVLQDVCGWPRTNWLESADQYAIASYLKTVHDSLSQSASHDPTR